AQGCDVVFQKRLSHRRQVMVTYLLPPAGGTICRAVAFRVLNRRLVGHADSIQYRGVVCVEVSSAGKPRRHILKVIAWILRELLVTAISKGALLEIRYGH